MPWELAVRAGAAAILAAGVGAVHLPRPATLCPLRALTGVPCPVCGTTTAVARLGRLDVMGAVAANPFALGALAVLVAAPLLAPLWSRLRPATRTVSAGLAVAGSWVWQLDRFHVLT